MRKTFGILFFALPLCFSRPAGAQKNGENTLGPVGGIEGPQSPSRDTEQSGGSNVDGAADAAARKKLGSRIEDALKKFDGEPSLALLQKAALSYMDADPETSKRWRSAPNRAALLPTLKFVVDHDLERDESLDRYQDEPDRWGADTDRDLGFQASVQWELDELVFNSDEIRIWGALADRASRREALLTALVGYYFERRKLQLKEQLSPPESLEETAELKLRIAELTASIDALTGGFLSRELKKNLSGNNAEKKIK